jgi:3-hydroxybutyrate dehydrogenase
LIEAATRELGRVGILVNNAGIQFTALVEEFPPERWDAILAINLSAILPMRSAASESGKKFGASPTVWRARRQVENA